MAYQAKALITNSVDKQVTRDADSWFIKLSICGLQKCTNRYIFFCQLGCLIPQSTASSTPFPPTFSPLNSPMCFFATFLRSLMALCFIASAQLLDTARFGHWCVCVCVCGCVRRSIDSMAHLIAYIDRTTT